MNQIDRGRPTSATQGTSVADGKMVFVRDATVQLSAMDLAKLIRAVNIFHCGKPDINVYDSDGKIVADPDIPDDIYRTIEERHNQIVGSSHKFTVRLELDPETGEVTVTTTSEPPVHPSTEGMYEEEE